MSQGNGSPRGGGPSGGIAAIALAAVAVVCCAAVPLVIALAGTVAVGTVLGVGAGLVAAVLLSVWVAVRFRR
jgi:hypothetical protein